MERKKLVEALKELPELVAEARKFLSWNDGDMVVNGILTDDEMKEYVELRLMSNRINDEIEAVRETIPFPTNQYPKEYQDILAGLQALKPRFDQEKAVQDAVVALKGRHTGGDLSDRLNLEDLANDVFHAWEKGAGVESYSDAYYALEKRRDRLDRVGTKVRKIRSDSWDAYNAYVNDAKAKKQAELNAQYCDLLKRYKQLERLMESRRRAKIGEVRNRIKSLLETVAQATALKDGKGGDLWQ